jgi:phosphatidylinositol mannoside-binding LppM-like protein
MTLNTRYAIGIGLSITDWQDVPVPRARRRLRILGLFVLFGLVMAALSGCLRVHAAMAVSQDDLVSGELVLASLPVNQNDAGPSVTVPKELADKVHAERYAADGYLGQKLTFENLEFTDVTLLTEKASTVTQYRISFQRSGNLVTMAGSIDLTQVPADRADIQIKVAFPGDITRTNGVEEGGTVSWSPKPGAVTEFDVTARYSGTEDASWLFWVLMVAAGAIGVALIVVLLALFVHRRGLRAERAAAMGRG